MRTTLLLAGLLYGAQELPKGAVGRLGKSSAEWSTAIMTLACSPDGKWVALARREGPPELWDLDGLTRTRILENPANDPDRLRFGNQSRIEEVRFLPGGTHIVGVGFGYGTRLWEAATGKLVWQVSEGRETLAVASDGALLLTVKGFKGDITVWDLRTKKELSTISGHKQSVTDLALSPDGKSVYSSSIDLTVRKWDLASRKELWRNGDESTVSAIGPTFPQHLRLSADGGHLAVTYHGCWSLGGKLLDPETGRVVHSVDIGHSDGLAFAPEGSLFAIQGKVGRPTLIDAATGKAKVRAPTKVDDRIFSMVFTPDGKRLLTTAGDGTLLVWDVARFETVPQE